MVMQVLRDVLTVIVLLLNLSVISFGAEPPRHLVHTSEDHHHTHYDYHDSGHNFASLITHSAPLYNVPLYESNWLTSVCSYGTFIHFFNLAAAAT
jgi:hypothetical protein